MMEFIAGCHIFGKFKLSISYILFRLCLRFALLQAPKIAVSRDC